ncbi:MAG: Amuc_1100 family pilus-like protein [Verrucomicrobiales bacterium]|nr:Amuc_1100 family pilus-like protein [Verrucomicrobiales bacterium]
MSQAQNKFLIGYGVVTVVGAGILTWLCMGASSAHDEQTRQVQEKADAVVRLKAKPLFPKQENVVRKKEQVNAYSQEVDKLHQAMLAYQKPLNPVVTPDDVRTKLGKFKAQLQALAQGRKIELPSNFDLGLDRYMNAAPLQAATPQVDYVVESVNTLLNSIFRRLITKLDVINVPEMPYEKGPATPATGAKKPGTTASAAKTTAAKTQKSKEVAPVLDEDKVFKRYHVYLSFTGPEKSVADAINDIATIGDGGPFFVINNLRVENDTKTGPQRTTGFAAQPLQQTPDPSAPPPTEGQEQKQVMLDARYILGNEKVTAFLDLDLVRFEEPAKPQAPAGGTATKPAPAPAPAPPPTPADSAAPAAPPQ